MSKVKGRARAGRPTSITAWQTAGGLDKLEVYRGLDVPEVWLWRAGEIEVHVLRDEEYSRAERSLLGRMDWDAMSSIGFMLIRRKRFLPHDYTCI